MSRRNIINQRRRADHEREEAEKAAALDEQRAEQPADADQAEAVRAANVAAAAAGHTVVL